MNFCIVSKSTDELNIDVIGVIVGIYAPFCFANSSSRNSRVPTTRPTRSRGMKIISKPSRLV